MINAQHNNNRGGWGVHIVHPSSGWDVYGAGRGGTPAPGRGDRKGSVHTDALADSSAWSGGSPERNVTLATTQDYGAVSQCQYRYSNIAVIMLLKKLTCMICSIIDVVSEYHIYFTT